MEISVCVGSSCHLKGSYEIINEMREHLKEDNLTEQVELKAAFCLGKCTDGVSIKINDEIICGVSKENFDEIYKKYIKDEFLGG